MDADEVWVMDFLTNIEKLGRVSLRLWNSAGAPAYLREAVRQTLHTRTSSPTARRRIGTSIS